MPKPAFKPRLLVLRDPRDGRTIRIELAARAGRFWLDIDSGSEYDGTRVSDRWHQDEAAARADLGHLLHSYQHAGYQVISDGATKGPAGSVPHKPRRLD